MSLPVWPWHLNTLTLEENQKISKYAIADSFCVSVSDRYFMLKTPWNRTVTSENILVSPKETWGLKLFVFVLFE